MLEMSAIGLQSNESATAVNHIPLRVTVLLTCALSIVGSTSIVLSYVCFKNSRSKARQILVHLSIVNLGAGLADLVGGVIYFDLNYEDAGSGNTTACKILASISLYCALSSILWSVTLSAHLYFVLTDYGYVTRHLILSCVFDYGLPVIFAIWFLSTRRLGYNRHLATCGVIYDIEDAARTRRRDIVAAVFGNDLLMYTAVVLVTALSVSISTQLRVEMSKRERDATHSSLRKMDAKFAVFPAAFVALRIWRSLQIALLIYSPNGHNASNGLKYTLGFLSGIGDAGQGITNALLFVLLSQKIRRNFVDRLCPWVKRTDPFEELNTWFRSSETTVQNLDTGSNMSNKKD